MYHRLTLFWRVYPCVLVQIFKNESQREKFYFVNLDEIHMIHKKISTSANVSAVYWILSKSKFPFIMPVAHNLEFFKKWLKIGKLAARPSFFPKTFSAVLKNLRLELYSFGLPSLRVNPCKSENLS